MSILHPLFSSSSGNCTFLQLADTALLIDAGVSGSKIEKAVVKAGSSMEKIQGIFVTHEHIDHILSIGVLSRKYKIPVYASRGTWEAMYQTIKKVHTICTVTPGQPFSIGNIHGQAFSLPHDAADPVGYTFWNEQEKVTVCTDIGGMSESLFLSLSGSDKVLLEANYDEEMLKKGNYPVALKKRIEGKKGHLSNTEAAMVAARLCCLGTKHIILGHLSQENNKPELAYHTVKKEIENCGFCVDTDISLSIAKRE